MTKNQIELYKAQETARANQAVELENRRKNAISLALDERRQVEQEKHNAAVRSLSAQQLAETIRHSQATEGEALRHNQVNEEQQRAELQALIERELAKLSETQRANLAREQETHRSNVVTEGETHRANKAREQKDILQMIAQNIMKILGY